jgi:hypothetical protein
MCRLGNPRPGIRVNHHQVARLIDEHGLVDERERSSEIGNVAEQAALHIHQMIVRIIRSSHE